MLVSAAGAVQEALLGTPISIRIGIHSGEPVVADGGYSDSTCIAGRG
jgi:class 3 adenylate cyclase